MRKSIDIFFKFMWNRWNEETCYAIFNECYLSEHIWTKWLNIRDDNNAIAAPAILWSELDSNCQQLICDYIKSINYTG